MSYSLSHGRPLDIGHIGVDPEALPPYTAGPIDLRGWFGPHGHRPLELEIGSGKGTFLVQEAAGRPDVNYIGLEYARAFWRYASDRCRRHGLANVRLVCVEAGFFVQYYVPDASLSQVHVYFPDPWPKKRHHKRRLLTADFLRHLQRVLVPGGLVRIATDHGDYFEWILDHAGRVADRLDRLPFDSPVSAAADELVGTNFERKYRREGRDFHGLALRKPPAIGYDCASDPRWSALGPHQPPEVPPESSRRPPPTGSAASSPDSPRIKET